MKILVVSDIHGSISAMETVRQVAEREKPQKIVFCGDLFGGWTSVGQISQMAQTVRYRQNSTSDR